MSQSPEKVFVSYSWDSLEHQQWILELVNKLRDEGYDANFDRGITSTSTVNLNQMMIEHMRDDDYIIMVLTDKYTAKANGFEGGVGFETLLSLPIIQQNLDKLIILIKQPDYVKKNIPFHLQGINYLDFSDPENFDERFEELVYRLQKVQMFELKPIGQKKVRQPQKEIVTAANTIVKDLKIPKLNPPTDLDKDSFIQENFQLILNGLDEVLNVVKNENSNFHFQKENINESKITYAFYVNGQNTNNLKIWLGSFFGGNKQIQFSTGRYINISNDNSMNGSVHVEVDEDFNFSLSMPMNMFSKSKNLSVEEVIKDIYTQHIYPYLK